jgi:hypothetical protein
LPVFGGCADRDPVVFDDVSDTEPVAGSRTEAEVAEGGIAAVGCGENGIVDLVPTCIGEDGGCGDVA